MTPQFVFARFLIHRTANTPKGAATFFREFNCNFTRLKFTININKPSGIKNTNHNTSSRIIEIKYKVYNSYTTTTKTILKFASNYSKWSSSSDTRPLLTGLAFARPSRTRLAWTTRTRCALLIPFFLLQPLSHITGSANRRNSLRRMTGTTRNWGSSRSPLVGRRHNTRPRFDVSGSRQFTSRRSDRENT